MLDVKDAYKIAKAGEEAELESCFDIGKAYVFYFNGGDGSSHITVDKKTSKKGIMTIPPISNIDILESGKKIPVSEITN